MLPLLTRRSRQPIRVLVLVSLLIALATHAGAAGLPEEGAGFEGEGPWVVRVHAADRDAVPRLAEEADLWGVLPEKEVSIVQVDRRGLERLRAQGFRVELDAERTWQLQRLGRPLRGQAGGIPGFPCYRTVEETYAAAEAMVAAYPELAAWIDIGDSWEKAAGPGPGYDLMVLRLANQRIPGPKPRLFVSTAVHAREYTTAELATRFAEGLLARYGSDPEATWILDHHEIHLLLHGNPDGRKRAETGLSWRKNTNDDYCSGTNNRGADLNRNYEFQWGCCGGSSGSQCSTTFRGASPASEPETQAIQAYLASLFPDQRPPDLGIPAPDTATGLAIDIHSFGQDVLWSWGFTTTQPPAPNGAQLYTLGRKYGFFSEYRPQHGSLSTVDGGGKDFAYGELGVPGYVIELGTTFFESCSVFESSILPGNLPALLYLAKVPRTPYLTPAGPEVLAPTLPPRAFFPGEAVEVLATLDDTRFTTLNGVEPVQAIAAGRIHVDTPPWEEGRGPGIPLAAADGAFDSPVEAASATVDTTGLAPGRHTLFVTADDALGNTGPVSGAFLHVIDPATAPTLEGFVRDGTTGLPLAAEVRVGPFAAASDASGFYRLRLPAGTYSPEATVAGFVSTSRRELTLATGQTLRRDLALTPRLEVFADDVEAGPGGWITESPWAITEEAAFSPTHSWTDSPGGPYANGADVSLTSPSFDLASLAGAVLAFRQLHDLERAFDFGRIELSTDGGQSWQEAAAITGAGPPGVWELLELPVPQLDGAPDARIRFRLDSDPGLTADGWHLDDLTLHAITAGQQGLFFGDGFEAGSLSAWNP